jgi:hypothetical protein
MKTTSFEVLLEVTPEHDTILRRLMRKYGWMMRWAFNRWMKDTPNPGAWERHLASDTDLP